MEEHRKKGGDRRQDVRRLNDRREHRMNVNDEHRTDNERRLSNERRLLNRRKS